MLRLLGAVALFGLVGALVLLLVWVQARPAAVAVGEAPEPIEVSLSGEEDGEHATLTVTRLAHAGVLVESGSERILLDPWFTDSALGRPGEPLGVALERLPPLTLLASGCAHPSHLDPQALALYPRKDVPVVLPAGAAGHARRLGFSDVRELRPEESFEVAGIRVTASPVRHRGPGTAYVLETRGFTVYFAGHAQLSGDLAEVRARFPRIDLALLPVGGQDLALVDVRLSMGPDDAAIAAALLHARHVVPLGARWQAGWLSPLLSTRLQVSEAFVDLLERHAPASQGHVLQPGQPLRLSRGEPPRAAPSQP